MPEENVELYRRVVDAFNRRDWEAFLALMDDDVQAAPFMAVMEGEYRGHAGVRRWAADLLDILPDYTTEIVAIRALEDATLAELRSRAHGRGSEALIEQRFWQAAKWRDKRMVWWGSFRTEAEALEAVGLRE